jgi:hypothetical protein
MIAALSGFLLPGNIGLILITYHLLQNNFKIVLDLELTPRCIVQLQMTHETANRKGGAGYDDKGSL